MNIVNADLCARASSDVGVLENTDDQNYAFNAKAPTVKPNLRAIFDAREAMPRYFSNPWREFISLELQVVCFRIVHEHLRAFLGKHLRREPQQEVDIETVQGRLARPLRKDDTHNVV